ncbi:MAG: UPF0175 family protein [Armatimonadetes bacterium]|nr:UPF0175 family protein [Armatimonadota bacterium]
MEMALPETLLERELRATVSAGLFRSEREALQEALSTWLAVKPSRRLEAAIQMFRSGEVSLSRAAEMAGVTRWRLQDLMAERGIFQEVEVAPVEELDRRAEEIGELRGRL